MKSKDNPNLYDLGIVKTDVESTAVIDFSKMKGFTHNGNQTGSLRRESQDHWEWMNIGHGWRPLSDKECERLENTTSATSQLSS